MTTFPARLAVFVSGGGSNLGALLTHFAHGDAAARAQVVLVVTNSAKAGALGRARDAGVPSHVLADPSDGDAILALLAAHAVDHVVCAGYLKLVPAAVTRAFRGRIVNIHPALLPAFGGHGMYGRHVHAAVRESGVRVTGATVHLVDEQYDRGPILAQWPVPVLPGDDAAGIAARVLAIEHRLLPATVDLLVQGAFAIADGAPTRTAAAAPALRFALHPDAGAPLAAELAALLTPPEIG